MTEEVKDQAKLKTRQPSLEYRQRALETHLAWAQSFRKEVVETRDSHLVEVDKRIQSLETDLAKLQGHRKEVVEKERHLAEVDQRIQSLETHLAGLQGHRKEVVETRDRALAEVDEKIQSLTKEINELSEIADLPAERQTTAIDYQS